MSDKRDHLDQNPTGNDETSAKGAGPGKAKKKPAKKPTLSSQALEARILMSATWADVDTGAAQGGATADGDLFTGDNAAGDTASGLAGNDIMHGNGGDDSLFGGAGDDQLFGGDGNDLLDAGGGNDLLDGGAGNDIFSLSGAGNGDTVTIIGGTGTDTINLSGYSSSQATFGNGSLTISLGGGQSFDINYSQVESITFSDVTATVLTGNHTATAFTGSAIFIDGGQAFKISISGAGSVDFSYNAATDSLTISDVDNTNTSTDLTITDMNGTDLNFASLTVDDDLDTLSTNVNIGDVTVRSGSSITTLTAGNGQGAIDTIHYDGDVTRDLTINGDVGSLEAYKVAGRLTIMGSVGSIDVANDMSQRVYIDGDVGTFNAYKIVGQLSIRGDVGSIDVANDISDRVFIGGDVGTLEAYKIAGELIIRGDAETINVTNDISQRTFVGGDLGTLTVGANCNGIKIGGNAGTIDVSGDINADVTVVGDLTHFQADNSFNYVLYIGQALGQFELDEGSNHVDKSYATTTYVRYTGSSNAFTETAGSGNLVVTDAGIVIGTSADNVINVTSDIELVDGGGGFDTANLSGIDEAMTIDLSRGTAVGEYNMVILDNVEKAIGGSKVDTFKFETPQAGRTYVIAGGGGTDILDLSNFAQSDIISSGSGTLTLSIGHGNAITIDYSSVETIVWGQTGYQVTNQGPVASNDAFSGSEDTPLTTGNVLSNDADGDGDALTVSSFTQAANGSVAYNNDGTFTYTPNANYNGTDSFTYTVSDGYGGTSTATINLTINAVNDGPAASDGSASGNEDTDITGNLSATDADGDALTYGLAGGGGPAHGQVTINPNGSYTYTPDANYNGTDSFTYTVSDGQGGTSTATINLTINAVNDGPVASDGSASGNEDTDITGNLSATDADGDALTYGLAAGGGPAHGQVTINPGGSYTYTPDANYNGTDSFTYTVSDGQGGTSTATINLTVAPVDEAPNDAQDGDVLTIIGDGGVNTIDLSDYSSSQATFRYGVITINMGGGGSFEIQHSDVEQIAFSDRTMRFVTWDGEGTTANGSEIVNWDIDALPGVDDILVFDNSSNDSMTFDAGFVSRIGGLIVGGGYTGTITIIGNLTVDLGVAIESGTINAGSGTVDINGDVHVAGGQLRLSSGETSIAGDLVVEGGTLTHNSGTLRLDGAGDQTINVNGGLLNVVTIDKSGGTLTLDGAMRITGNFTHVAGDVQGGDSSVTFEGSGTTIAAGSVQFNDVTINTSTLTISGDMHVRDDLTISGLYVLNGGSIHVGGDVTTMDSSWGGTATIVLDGAGDQTVGTGAAASGELGNFTINKASGTVTLQGNLEFSGNYTHLNGDVDASNSTVKFQNSGYTVTAGSTVFNDVIFDTSTVTIGGTMSVAGDLTVSSLYVLNGGSIRVSGDVTTLDTSWGGTATIVLEGSANQLVSTGAAAAGELSNFTIDKTGGTVTLQGNLEFSGNFTHLNGNVDASNSTVKFQNSGYTVTAGSTVFNDVIFDTSTVTIGGTMSVAGDLTVSSLYVLNGGSIRVSGDVTTTDTSWGGTATIVLEGSSNQLVSTGAAAAGELSNFTIDKTGGTVTLLGNLEFSGNYTHLNGNVDASNSTVKFQNSGSTVTAGGTVFNDVIFDTSTVTIGGTMSVAGDLTVSSLYVLNGGSIRVSGDVTTTDTSWGGTATIVLEGSANQLVSTGAAAAGELSNFTIDKTGGTVTLLGNLEFSGNFTHLNGDVDASGSTVKFQNSGYTVTAGSTVFNDVIFDTSTVTIGGTMSVAGDLTVSSLYVLNGGSIRVSGDVTTLDTSWGGTATIVLEGSGNQTVGTGAAAAGELSNFTIDKTGGTVTLLGNLEFSGNFTHLNGDVDASGSTVKFQNSGKTVTAGGMAFDNVIIDTSTLTISGDMAVAGNLTIQSIYQLNGGRIVVSGNITSQDSSYSGSTKLVMTGGSASAAMNAANDTIKFEQITAGAVYNVDGGGGNDTLDLRSYYDYQVTNDGSTITVDMGGGQSFTINHTNVENILTSANAGPTAGNDAYSLNENGVLTTGNVLANDSDPDGNPLAIIGFTQAAHGSVVNNNDGTFTYTPNANFSGSDSFNYTISDGHGGQSTASVNLTVNAVNDAPVAWGGSASGNEDSVINGNLSAFDVDGDALSFGLVDGGGPAHGNVTINPDGSFSYTPGANYNGTDSFTYRVSDGNGGTSTATINLTIHAMNDGPVASGGSVSGSEDSDVSGTLSASDVDGDALSFGLADGGEPAHGSVTINPDGSFSYTPEANYNGTDSFTYTVSDGRGGTSTATITLTIHAVNDGPEALDDSAAGDEDTVISGNLTASDVDGDALTFGLVDGGGPAHGNVTINPDGSFSYTPEENYNGTDSFTYTVSDGNGGTSTATITLTIHAVNDGPEALDDSAAGDEDTVISGNLTASDVDGDALTFGLVDGGGPAHGNVTINPDGSFSYTPEANYNGTDSFTYRVSDGNGGTSTATITLTIHAVNDAPIIDAGLDQQVSGGALVTLAPQASDPDGDQLTYRWVQTGGPAVSLDDPDAMSPTFTAPELDSNVALTFELQVSDGHTTVVDQISITVERVPAAAPPPVIDPPVAPPILEVPDEDETEEEETPVLEEPAPPEPEIPDPVLEAPLPDPQEPPIDPVIELLDPMPAEDFESPVVLIPDLNGPQDGQQEEPSVIDPIDDPIVPGLQNPPDWIPADDDAAQTPGQQPPLGPIDLIGESEPDSGPSADYDDTDDLAILVPTNGSEFDQELQNREKPTAEDEAGFVLGGIAGAAQATESLLETEAAGIQSIHRDLSSLLGEVIELRDAVDKAIEQPMIQQAMSGDGERFEDVFEVEGEDERIDPLTGDYRNDSPLADGARDPEEEKYAMAGAQGSFWAGLWAMMRGLVGTQRSQDENAEERNRSRGGRS